MTDRSDIFVSADWLEDQLGKPGLSIIDGSWYLPAQKRDARGEYEAEHIPGGVFFDHDAIVDPESNLPHALPKPETFARLIGGLGIAAEDEIVVYDGPGLFTAPRVRWMLRVMGAKNVRILEGGVARWKAGGRPLTDEPTKFAPNVFNAVFDERQVASLDDVREASQQGTAQIADARPAGRFTGDEPEPREGMRSGHMPGAFNLPALGLARDGKLLPEDELRKAVEDAGIDASRPVITSCGSGVTAAVISLALESLGRDSRLYDGSWSEWGGRSDTQVETGPR